ncbi:MAG: hypothetical protein KDF63_06180 [Rhodoferax sp.]|nr:hypothetical protein [Rhodoferax sp.]
MRTQLRIAVCAVLAWQAIGTVQSALARRPLYDDGVPFADYLTADTATRLRAVLGPDAEIVGQLRDATGPGQIVLNRVVQGSLEELQRNARDERELAAMFEQLAAKNGLFVQLTGFLYPDPFFLSVPDPIVAVEDYDGPEARPWLFVLDGDPTPSARPGWTLAHHRPRFELWQFRKD